MEVAEQWDLHYRDIIGSWLSSRLPSFSAWFGFSDLYPWNFFISSSYFGYSCPSLWIICLQTNWKLWYKLIHRSYHHYRPRHLSDWAVVAAQFPLIPCITCICSPIEGRKQIPTWLAHLRGTFHYGSYYWYQICEDYEFPACLNWLLQKNWQKANIW